MTSLICSFVCCLLSWIVKGGDCYDICESCLEHMTYVNHVRNICHLELANHLTKCTLLVIE